LNEMERTQPAYGTPAPDPGISEPDRPAVTTDNLGTRLVGVDGLYNGHTFALVGETNTVGRGNECQVCLGNDITVSRVHARIVLEENGHKLYDEGSSNGTYVNGVLMSTCTLAPGDVIQCGGSKLKYE
jgi:pSer/pThr/pTyr-binding forkhead associated (FHA) protein